MAGELKRHFRDRAWAVHVNRRLQELHLRIARAVPELSQRLQRMPSAADLAGELGESEEEIHLGLQCAGAYTTRSLSDTATGTEGTPLAEFIGDLDQQLELVPDRIALREMVSRLPSREQEILRLRFDDNLTQADIANLIGVSQMHVSRLLGKAFAELRRMLLEENEI
jgi:RNA polymerase sigma-B factor